MAPQFPDEHSDSGNFERQEDDFREAVSDSADAKYSAEAGRYHLYVSLACPWAHRSLIVRNLCALQDAVSFSVVDPIRDDRGWAFREGAGYGPDPFNGFQFLSEAYHATDPDFQGRVTVPVLWDRKTSTIVNNSEDDICEMFATVFSPLGSADSPLFPESLHAEQEELSEFIYEKINNGVYRAGFASKQDAYEKAVTQLFDALDTLEKRVATREFLLADHPVETDWRLFCTLIRFDAVYHGHFKCNVRRIIDYPNLWRHTRTLYALPGIADTVNFDHIKRHYYVTHDDINPTGIVPVGPHLDL